MPEPPPAALHSNVPCTNMNAFIFESKRTPHRCRLCSRHGTTGGYATLVSRPAVQQNGETLDGPFGLVGSPSQLGDEYEDSLDPSDG